jgi:hypothetical protein
MNKAKTEDKIYMGCRCYERLQLNTKEFTRLAYTELVLELEHLKIETRLITEMFVNVMNREVHVDFFILFFVLGIWDKWYAEHLYCLRNILYCIHRVVHTNISTELGQEEASKEMLEHFPEPICQSAYQGY